MGDEAQYLNETVGAEYEAQKYFRDKRRGECLGMGKATTKSTDMAGILTEPKKTTTAKTKAAAPTAAVKTVNGVTETMIARYHTVDQSHKELGKEREKLGETIKKLLPDNQMHIFGPYTADKKCTEAMIMDKDILFKLVSERIGVDEATEMFELAKAPSPRVTLTVKKAAS